MTFGAASSRRFQIALISKVHPSCPDLLPHSKFSHEVIKMNWKLIFALSLFGLAMAVASLFGLGYAEPFLWLVIFIIYAWVIATRAPGKYFLHGFLVSIVNSIWITAIHATFFSIYAKNNPQFVQSAPPGRDPRVLMIIFGPLFGVLFGLVAGLFTFIASKIVKKRA